MLVALTSATTSSISIVLLMRRSLRRRRHRLGQHLGHVVLVVQQLPLQVVQLDKVAVDDAQVAHTRTRQVVGQHRARRADADDRDVRVQQPLLSGLADAGKDRLPRHNAPV